MQGLGPIAKDTSLLISQEEAKSATTLDLTARSAYACFVDERLGKEVDGDGRSLQDSTLPGSEARWSLMMARWNLMTPAERAPYVEMSAKDTARQDLATPAPTLAPTPASTLAPTPASAAAALPLAGSAPHGTVTSAPSQPQVNRAQLCMLRLPSDEGLLKTWQRGGMSAGSLSDAAAAAAGAELQIMADRVHAAAANLSRDIRARIAAGLGADIRAYCSPQWKHCDRCQQLQTCAACFCALPPHLFSATQLQKKPHLRWCLKCVDVRNKLNGSRRTFTILDMRAAAHDSAAVDAFKYNMWRACLATQKAWSQPQEGPQGAPAASASAATPAAERPAPAAGGDDDSGDDSIMLNVNPLLLWQVMATSALEVADEYTFLSPGEGGELTPDYAYTISALLEFDGGWTLEEHPGVAARLCKASRTYTSFDLIRHTLPERDHYNYIDGEPRKSAAMLLNLLGVLWKDGGKTKLLANVLDRLSRAETPMPQQPAARLAVQRALRATRRTEPANRWRIECSLRLLLHSITNLEGPRLDKAQQEATCQALMRPAPAPAHPGRRVIGAEGTDNQAVCAECVSSLAVPPAPGQSVRTLTLPCGHACHGDCLRQWTDGGSGTCPACGHPLDHIMKACLETFSPGKIFLGVTGVRGARWPPLSWTACCNCCHCCVQISGAVNFLVRSSKRVRPLIQVRLCEAAAAAAALQHNTATA
jgi:hypothetical protein